MSRELELATIEDIDELMTWFPDAHSVDIWGGPRFRYPFDRDSFHADCRWQDYASYCLRESGVLSAFGQMGLRYGRAHLARLVVNPAMRGRGIGRSLLQGLVREASLNPDCAEAALFVYQNNEPAYRCYLALGFEVQAYPDDAPMRDECYYLTKSLAPDS